MKIGLLGAGRIGAFHARTLAALPGVSELLVADADQVRARTVAADTGGTAVSDTAEAIRRADAVVIATATDTHSELICRAAEAGMPVFCEKPIALDLDTTDRALETVETTGVPLQIGFQRRFDEGFVEARRLVETGDIGRIYAVRLATHDPAPPPEAYLRASGGLFRDLAIHDFDLLRWVTGEEVVEIYAAGATLIGDPAFEATGDIDTAAFVARLSGGGLAIFSGTRHDPRGYDVRLELFGSKDSVMAGMDARSPIRGLGRSSQKETGMDTGDEYPDFMTRFEAAYRAELSDFIDVAAGKGEPRATGRDARAALRIALAAERSMAERRPVTLDETP
ncbi:MAG: Gfo/Idh/MocA family oxidoreductase [Chloroflexi bacterium]|nr:Gfo/Idh/MocA family oxidoreductase [Chloroflexota bacterium]